MTNWFKKQYFWFKNLGKLQQFNVIIGVVGVLAFLMAIPSFVIMINGWISNPFEDNESNSTNLTSEIPIGVNEEDFLSIKELRPKNLVYPYDGNTTTTWQVLVKEGLKIPYSFTLEFIHNSKKYHSKTFFNNITDNYIIWYYPNKKVGENKIHVYLNWTYNGIPYKKEDLTDFEVLDFN